MEFIVIRPRPSPSDPLGQRGYLGFKGPGIGGDGALERKVGMIFEFQSSETVEDAIERVAGQFKSGWLTAAEKEEDHGTTR